MKKIPNFQKETGFKNENKRKVFCLNSQRYQADILAVQWSSTQDNTLENVIVHKSCTK